MTLAEGATTGQHLIRLIRPGKEIAVGTFQVQAYVLEKADLKIELSRAVVFRGETVKAEVVARSQYGTPLIGRPVEVKLPDGRTVRGTTDALGKFAVEFPTDGFAEEQSLAISARLPQDNVAASSSVMLALRAFRIDLATDRTVYLDGETFRLRASTLDPLGEPLGQSLAVSVLKRIKQDEANLVEREVAAHKLETDPKTGKGEVSLKVDDEDGGSYVLRASGTDRFGNAIFEDQAISISGRKDSTKLRLLTDRTSFRVGEPGKVNLHNRGGAGLALVTWEADRVLRYRLVDVKGGDNPLEWEVDGAQVPYFTLAATRMEGTWLDEARLDLSITRDLRVSLKPIRPTIAPGEEVVLEVTTLDQLDRPVAAELSLALVDRALLRLHADTAPPIGPFFNDRTRTNAFTTGTTNAFRYSPTSRPVAGASKPAAVAQRAATVPPPGQAGPAPSMMGGEAGASNWPRRRPIMADDLRAGVYDPASHAVVAKLDEVVPMNFPTDTSLEDVVKYVRRSTISPEFPEGLPIYVDPQGLQDTDKTMASTVMIDLTGVPLKTTLRLLLRQLSLTYTIDEGLLTITSTASEDVDFDQGQPNGAGMAGMGGMGMGGMGGAMGGMGGGFQGQGPCSNSRDTTPCSHTTGSICRDRGTRAGTAGSRARARCHRIGPRYRRMDPRRFPRMRSLSRTRPRRPTRTPPHLLPLASSSSRPPTGTRRS